MAVNTEINALLQLIDDPDQEVFDLVSQKIVAYGKPIIPSLENLWENTPEEHTQERIEMLIHRLHFRDLSDEFYAWSRELSPDLLTGILIVCRYQYPDLNVNLVLQEVEKIRRNTWLELNNYLTPLEQVNIISSILYNYYNLKGVETSYQDVNDFLLHKTIETKRGNSIGIGLLYLVLCTQLDVPVFSIALPEVFGLAYFKQGYSTPPSDNPFQYTEFFIHPANGQVYTVQDVRNYLHKLEILPKASFFQPLDSFQIIKRLLLEMSKCFTDEKSQYKQNELQALASMLGD